MMIHEITALAGAHKKKMRVGRGESSGKGKTCGRGTKGGGARAGKGPMLIQEGGARPLYRRLPKRGFNNNYFTQRFSIVNISDLEKFFDVGATVDVTALISKGLVRDERYPVKILGNGELTKKLAVVAGKFSKQAADKIAKVGGSTQTLELNRNKAKQNPKTGKFNARVPAAKKPAAKK
jgi:large subunit ribosomal protein L15